MLPGKIRNRAKKEINTKVIGKREAGWGSIPIITLDPPSGSSH